jgi:hypothetical protein
VPHEGKSTICLTPQFPTRERDVFRESRVGPALFVTVSSKTTPRTIRLRTPTALSLVAVTVAGFYAKFYDGPGRVWVNDSLAGFFYVVFWCLLASLVFRRVGARRIAVVVLVVTSLLEVLQLWQPPFLVWLRSGFAGRALLGHTFAAWDFPYYVAGALIGWLWIAGLWRCEGREAN